MTLYSIEKALRPQFTWSNNPNKKFQTSLRDERYASLGLMVFIGIAHAFGIDKVDIMDYTCIESKEFDTKLENFEDNWFMVRQRKEVGNLLFQRDFIDRVYLKTKLTLNALNSQFLGDPPQCKLHL